MTREEVVEFCRQASIMVKHMPVSPLTQKQINRFYQLKAEQSLRNAGYDAKTE